MTSYLPQHPGLLPKWLFLVSLISSLNSYQAYASPSYTSQLYNSTPSTPLSSRTFGTWTLLSSVIRMYAAYYPDEKHVYDLAMWTYGIAWVHFVSEWVVYGSARAKGRFLGPLVVATASLGWMGVQRGWYLGL